MWLPIGIAIVFWFGDFSFGIYDQRPMARLLSAMLFLFPLMWLLGVPLTLAVILIHRRSRAWAFAVALFSVPISVYAYFLSVPLPGFLNTLFGAAVAWLVLLSMYLTDLCRWLEKAASEAIKKVEE